MIIKSPESPEEWTKYFDIRWQVLRAPWQQPRGSEKDEIEFHDTTFHAMAIYNNNEIIGVARLHLLENNEAQIRFMAIDKNFQGKGTGKILIDYLEKIAKINNVNKILLQARENALVFYEKQNYRIKEKTFIMYNQIQHYLMEKHL
jgi:N-acetylglutamate synthase-like GNAT family acetyltransferase